VAVKASRTAGAVRRSHKAAVLLSKVAAALAVVVAVAATAGAKLQAIRL